MSKPSIPQGTRDFSPAEVRRRQYILKTLEGIFASYGFQPLETPAMEQLTTLTGKYGEEGDRLIFKILNNGLHEKKDKIALNMEWSQMLDRPYSSPAITERALRYDLTIPFARYVVMHQNETAFPFRRYQMQPVWRADRPQRGRYREFWQCDCDIVGSNALINEAELLSVYQQAFDQLGIPRVTISINSRKLLQGLASAAGQPEKMMDITVALDKFDKIGWEGVSRELDSRGVTTESIAVIEQFINVTGSNEEKLNAYESLLKDQEDGLKGIAEIRNCLQYHRHLAPEGARAQIVVDIRLARGLNYYTGIILEVTTTAVKMGSIGGGGRYDDLTGLFGLKGMSGVGISFGIDRIYDVLEELNLFPEQPGTDSTVMVVNFGKEEELYALQIVRRLRLSGIAAEVFPDNAKFDRQMKYANKRNIPFVILPGEEERKEGVVSLKDFRTGEQRKHSIEEVISILKS